MSPTSLPRLIGERIVLMLPDPAAAERVAAYFRDNRDFHAPTEPPRDEAFYTAEHWRHQLVRNRAELEQDIAARFFIFNRGDADQPAASAIGHCNLSHIVRGPIQGCNLGYSLDRRHEGRGFMHEALTLLIEFAFTELRLHRVAAGYLPTNERSGRVLRRLGFTVEGYARDYLFIAGHWRDHILTALVNPDQKPPGA